MKPKILIVVAIILATVFCGYKCFQVTHQVESKGCGFPQKCEAFYNSCGVYEVCVQACRAVPTKPVTQFEFMGELSGFLCKCGDEPSFVISSEVSSGQRPLKIGCELTKNNNGLVCEWIGGTTFEGIELSKELIGCERCIEEGVCK